MKKKIFLFTLFILAFFNFSNVFAFSRNEYARLLVKFTGEASSDTLDLLQSLESQYTYYSIYSDELKDITFCYHNSPSVDSTYGYTKLASGKAYVISCLANSTTVKESTTFTLRYGYKTNSGMKYNACPYVITNYPISIKNDSPSDLPANVEYNWVSRSPAVSVLNDDTIILPAEPSDENFQITLPEIYRQSNLEEVMREVLMVLPIVIGCLVLWIGLRKTLVFLQNLLNKS